MRILEFCRAARQVHFIGAFMSQPQQLKGYLRLGCFLAVPCLSSMDKLLQLDFARRE
jgi:hypothetical protein